MQLKHANCDPSVTRAIPHATRAVPRYRLMKKRHITCVTKYTSARELQFCST